ncbi:vacuolar protein sorting-associated protein 9, putative [Plasmodium chabaudi adami]|uniref:Vacuolar protein sorting-associated protein 9, putative n=1 Tax=Plasmodium chabaudi adami TaxID=5826 RepID=A0A1D3LJH4_PLACE|nr:vacuolar protein sorting-associated protein 9, putative [Plasmodium chabaudi adami]
MNENPNCDNNFMLGKEWDEFNFKDKEKKYLNENHGNPNQINEMDFFFENYNNKNNANISQFSNSASGKNGIQGKSNINGSSDTNFNKYLTNNVNDSLWGESNESYNVVKNKKERSKTPIKKASQKSNKLISSMDEVSNTFDAKSISTKSSGPKLNADSTFDLWEKFTEYDKEYELAGNDLSYEKKKKKKKNPDEYIVHTGKGSINNSNIYKKSDNDNGISVVSKNNRNVVKENEKIKNSAEYHTKCEKPNTVTKSDSFYEGEFTPSLKSGNKLSSYDDINLNSEHDIKIEYCSDKSISQCKVVNSNSNKISIKKKNSILLDEDYEKNIYNKKKKNKDLLINSNDNNNNNNILSDSKHSVSSLQVNKTTKKKSESGNSNSTSKYRYISTDNNNIGDAHTKAKEKISKKITSSQELVSSYKDCTSGAHNLGDAKSKEEMQLKSEIKKKKITKSINNPNRSQSYTSMIDDSEHTYYDNTKFSEQSSSNLLKLDESSEFFCNSNTIGDENLNGKIKKIKTKKGTKEEKTTKKKNIENIDNNKKEVEINKSGISKQVEQNYTFSSEENQTFESIKTNDSSKFFDEIKEYLHNKSIKETANAEKKTDYNFNEFDDLNEDIKLKKKQTIRTSSKNTICSDKEKVRNSSSSAEKLSKVPKTKERVKSVYIMNESEFEIKSNEGKIKGEKGCEKKRSIKQKSDEGVKMDRDVKKINEAKMYNSNSTINSNFSNNSNLKKKKNASDKATALHSIDENNNKFYGGKEIYTDMAINNEGNKIDQKGSIKNGIHTDIVTDEDDTTINYNDDENETVNSNSNSNKLFVKKKKDSSMDGNEVYGPDLGFEETEVKKADNKNEDTKNEDTQSESLIQKGRKFKNMFISFIKRESYKKDEENEEVDENKIITKKEFIKWNEMNLNMYNENGNNEKTVSSLYGFRTKSKSVSGEFNDINLSKLEQNKKSGSNENNKTFSNDTMSENNSNAKKKANTIYNNFLESLKHPSCKIVVDQVKKFILNFPQNLSREEAANRIHTFINETQPILLKSSIYKNLNADQINIIIQGYEKFIIQKLYFYLYRMDPEDKDQDEQIYTKINCLQWVELKHLEISENIDLDRLKLAQGELLKIQKMKAPYDKIIMILNCCRIVTSILFEAKKNSKKKKNNIKESNNVTTNESTFFEDNFGSNIDTKQMRRDSQITNSGDSNNMKDELSTSVFGSDERNDSKNDGKIEYSDDTNDDELLPCADEVLPLLIYVIVKTNPPELISNITFIQSFRHPNHFVSEEAYSFTQFCSGVEFIKELGKTTFLNISEKEYKEKVSKAEEFYLNEVKESNKKLQETAGKLNDFIKLSNEKKLNNNIITKIESIKLKYENVKNFNTITISDLSSLFEEYKVLVELKKSILKDLQDHA